MLCGSVRSPPFGGTSTPKALASEEASEEQVHSFLALRAQAHRRHRIRSRGGGIYELDGRTVRIEWQLMRDSSTQGRLVVVDGPLRQPLADYLEATEANAEYEAVVTDVAPRSVHTIPKERRLSFGDQHQQVAYTRLDAMKIAKEQALVRERAAGFLQAGQALPDDLMANYAKAIQQKLAPVAIHKIRERALLLP